MPALVAALALSGSLVSGCTSEPSQEEAEAAVCDSNAEVQAAVADVAALDADSTFDEVEDAEQGLSSSVDQLRESAADVPEADATAVSAARDEIASAVEEVSGQDTLGDAATAVSASTASHESALEEISNGVECDTAT